MQDSFQFDRIYQNPSGGFRGKERERVCHMYRNNREVLLTKESINRIFLRYISYPRCQVIVQYKSYHLVASGEGTANLPAFNSNEKQSNERMNACACSLGRLVEGSRLNSMREIIIEEKEREMKKDMLGALADERESAKCKI